MDSAPVTSIGAVEAFGSVDGTSCGPGVAVVLSGAGIGPLAIGSLLMRKWWSVPDQVGWCWVLLEGYLRSDIKKLLGPVGLGEGRARRRSRRDYDVDFSRRAVYVLLQESSARPLLLRVLPRSVTLPRINR